MATKQELEQQDLVQQQKEAVKELMRKMKANTIYLGADLVEVRETELKPIIDKETNQQKKDKDGQDMFWQQRYYAKFAFMGGEVETEVNSKQYEELKENINMPYFLTGRLSKIRSFGSEVTAPVFQAFDLLA